MERIHHRVALAGRVTLPDGSVAVGAQVELRRQPRKRAGARLIKAADDTVAPLRSTVSRSDGTFYFLDLAVGTYELAARQSLLIEDRWTRCTATVKVPVPTENETDAAEPALPVFVKIELSKLD